MFYGFWSWRDVQWTFVRFIVAIAPPVLHYVYCSMLVPPDPASVTSWREYFFDIRIPLFATGILVYLATVLSNSALRGVPLSDLTIMYVAIALNAIGLG